MAIKCIFDSAADEALLIGWSRDAVTGETERSVEFADIENGAAPGNGYWDNTNSKVKEGIPRDIITSAQAALWAWHNRLEELARILEDPVVITRHPQATRDIAGKILFSLHRGMYVRANRAGTTLATLATILTNSAMGPTGGYNPNDPETVADLIDALPSGEREVKDCILVTNDDGTSRRSLADMIENDIKIDGETTPTTAQLKRGRWINDVSI